MSEETSIHQYAELGETILKGWGRRATDQDSAIKDIIKEGNLDGIMLCTLLKRMDDVLQVLCQKHIREPIDAAGADIVDTMEIEVKNREEKHGPCPVIVRRAFMHDLCYQVGKNVYHQYLFPAKKLNIQPGWVQLPEKGTLARREYDNWMRRKPPKPKTPPMPPPVTTERKLPEYI